MTDTVLVLGGRSDIGRAVAHRFAAAGHPVALAARNAPDLEADRADIAIRHDVEATLHEFDALDTDALGDFVDAFDPVPGIVVSAIGAMGDQTTSETDPAAAAQVMRINYEAPAQVLELFAARMAARGGGTLVGISSVAGDRGRAVNYVYGSAKAGFTAYLSGLRNRLWGTGVHVVTVKPGFVETRMTEGMDLPGALTARPEAVAETIFQAVARGRSVVYVKPVWRAIMIIIGAIPEPIFRRTRIGS
ncbi:SDR family oxidoreductase [Lutimaribacter sp. EGI FJ00015]|uniref:SDR family oxidoreductase n=1 Tax=Lutimaribacter degradans TaxID=2945989 RepID=A0ACC5ZW44_9RHOB|nr:SDR family oxidoreductase [Lutimaribacter sp. EGI FJ00013]MCM2562320.1 SDR family oxidoreductase [Lutimaribacter sp. EGI FJ00013]MCO0613475.1 SDR family oxidoreductase [Lutimaribacter sp. EGI FJ00015]MCO0636449.1 SDR family oxidoreductase [Lutimaribacter sp. EGI FJ00014]